MACLAARAIVRQPLQPSSRPECVAAASLRKLSLMEYLKLQAAVLSMYRSSTHPLPTCTSWIVFLLAANQKNRYEKQPQNAPTKSPNRLCSSTVAFATAAAQINGQLLCGFTGLWTDVLTVMQDLSSEVALKSLGEGDRPISPAALAGLLSTLLYSRRGSPFFVEPIVAGLDSRGKPYLCGQVRLLAS